MEELRAKLQQRIEDMRRKRKADTHEVAPAEKAKRKEEKKKKSEEKKKARKLAVGATPKKTEDVTPTKADVASKEEDESSSDGVPYCVSIAAMRVPISRQDEDIKFGTFDFGSGKPVPTYLSKKKSKPTLQQALQRVRVPFMRAVSLTCAGGE